MPELTFEESVALANLMLATAAMVLAVVVVCWHLFHKR